MIAMTKDRIQITHSPEETMLLAKDIGSNANPGDIYALTGDLGSGKTTFMKGFAQGAGVHNTDEVKSPTFVLMHVYEGRVPIYHFDLYRLDELKDMSAINLEEFMGDRGGISCIEWAEKAEKILPDSVTVIQFEVVDKMSRKIIIKKGCE